jgi:hypothetical protein
VDKLNQRLTLVANLGVIAAWRELMITDPELSRTFRVYSNQGIEALDEDGRYRIAALVNNVMGTYENAYCARRYGIIGDEEWCASRPGPASTTRRPWRTSSRYGS